MKISKSEIIKELSHFKVLFVEDEPTTRMSSSLILQDIFKELIIAENGKQAIEQIKKEKFDLIITDIIMPEIDGFEVVKFAKTNAPNTITFILSSYFDTDTLLKAIEVDVDGFLVKPFNLDIFLNTIKKTLNYKLQLDEEINLLKQYKEIVDESLIVSKTDIHGNITYVNKAFEEISGFKSKELIGKNHNIVRHPDVKKEVFEELWKTILNKKTWKGIIKNRKKNGESYYVESIVKPILDKNGNIKEFIALRKDITNYISAENLINDKLKLQKSKYLLTLVKIDNFSDIKLIYEEDILLKLKNRLLKKVKNLLKNHFSSIEEYWVKDDIFGLLIEKFDTKNLEEIMNVISNKVNNYPILIDDLEYYPFIRISFSYEGDLYNNTLHGLEELSFSEEKVICANGLTDKKKQEVMKNMEMLKTIEYAIQNNKVISLFQPIIDNITQKPIKYESLVRIIDKNEKILSPFFFLDIAKKAGIYSHITQKVLENSFKVYKEKNIPISINLSPSDIVRNTIKEKIISLLKKYKPAKGMITFELLEDEIIKFPNIIKEFINEVKSLNVEIAIDDFGEGYSNFTRVADLQADWIKIDGSLIKEINKDHIRQNIVQAIVNFAKKENKKTVAEFVENKEIYEILQKLGVDYSQGYYFNKPLDVKDL